MIITCPECATRYDLEDERFLPNGRSVRCTACGESWFVPAPESIDALARREPVARNASRSEARREREDDGDRGYERAPAAREKNRGPAYDDDDDLRARRRGHAGDYAASDGYDKEGRPREAEVSIVRPDKDLLPPRDEKGRFMPRAASEDDDDDSLFNSPSERKKAKPEKNISEAAARDAEGEAPPKGWRKGKQFYVEETDREPEEDPRPFFAKHFSKNKHLDEAPSDVRRDASFVDRAEPESVRYRHVGDDDDAQVNASLHAMRDKAPNHRDARGKEAHTEYTAEARRRDSHSDFERDHERDHDRDRDYDRYRHAARDEDAYAYERDYDRDYDREYDRDYGYDDDIIPGEARILDADWEDVDSGMGPRFGRRIREKRRRATALARLEDVRRFEPNALDEEFFRSLRVTPLELEKAVRKARRRAEARDKNRMTPWRAFGWSAWVAAVAAAAYAVVAYRDEIVKVAPTTADAYAVVGIETDPFGLKIENVRHRLAMSTGGPMIEISGSLKNRGAEAVDAPLLQAEALGPRGELLARWTFRPEEPTVDGAGVVTFTTRNAAPEGVAEVALTFAPAQSSIPAQ